MTRPISDLDAPLTRVQEQLRDLVARQREAVASVPDDQHLERLADASAARLRTLLAPAKITPEEAS